MLTDIKKSARENESWVRIPKQNTSSVNLASNCLNSVLDSFRYSGTKSSLVILVIPLKTLAAVEI